MMKGFFLRLRYPAWVGVDPWGAAPRFYVLRFGRKWRVPAWVAARKFVRP